MSKQYWRDRQRAIESVKNKPCNVCGQPSSCAILSGGFQPLCIDHKLQAQRLGNSVVFPKGR